MTGREYPLSAVDVEALGAAFARTDWAEDLEYLGGAASPVALQTIPPDEDDADGVARTVEAEASAA